MPEYIPKPDIVIAQKWEGHGQKMDAALNVSVQENAGLSGYYKKMGYFYDHKGAARTLRPNEYLVRSANGEIFTMPPEMFEEKYVRNTKSSVSNTKSSQKVEKKPKVVDTKEDEFEDNLI